MYVYVYIYMYSLFPLRISTAHCCVWILQPSMQRRRGAKRTIAWNLFQHLHELLERQDLVCVPSGYVNIAIENGHRNSEFSHKKCDFP